VPIGALSRGNPYVTTTKSIRYQCPQCEMVIVSIGKVD
jgi:hypothetical protein